MTPEQMESLADMLADRLMGTFAGRLDMIEEVVFAESYVAPTEVPDIGPMDKEWTVGGVCNIWGLHRSSIDQAIEEGRIQFSVNGKGWKTITTQQMAYCYG